MHTDDGIANRQPAYHRPASPKQGLAIKLASIGELLEKYTGSCFVVVLIGFESRLRDYVTPPRPAYTVPSPLLYAGDLLKTSPTGRSAIMHRRIVSRYPAPVSIPIPATIACRLS